jgi:hypothetical protein
MEPNLAVSMGPSMPSLAPFGQAVSEEKIFLTLANQKKELILATMFVGQDGCYF